MVKERYLYSWIKKDLNKKMVFLSGPRQVGKTTLAILLGRQEFRHVEYLNWDDPDHQKRILQRRFSKEAKLLIFDEIHKLSHWKTYLKGLYDTHKDQYRILVTGSARLDTFRRGGDSLLGRYHSYRLHPFSLAELLEIPFPDIQPFSEIIFPIHRHADTILKDLDVFGGFPEIVLKKDLRDRNRWHAARLDRLIKGDIRDTSLLRDISSLLMLATLLPSKVGSRFSLNSLREDLNVTHKTVAHWVSVLEHFYYHFRIFPFASTAIKSLRKEPKLYLWDWSEVEEASKRLENLVASHLLKFVHGLNDIWGMRAELFYLRDRDGREVDFLVAVKRQPWFAVEVKLSDENPSPHLRYYTERLHIPHLYHVVGKGGFSLFDTQHGVTIIGASRFLSGLF